MKSKIIKVSIILIFMMFSAGLFNFCFAFEATNVKEVSINTTASISETFKVGELSNIPDVTVDNITGVDATTYYNYYINSGYFMFISSSGNLYMYILISAAQGMVPALSDSGFKTTANILDSSRIYSTFSSRFMYNVETGNWELTNASVSPTFPLSNVIYVDSSIPFFGYNSPGDKSSGYTLVYDFTVKEPTEEDLITNCDFKVNFKFSPDNDDYPTKVDKHWYVYETCLVTHTMSNWDNYKIDMSISANKENSRGGANTYFELYNNNGDKLIDKHNLENNVAVGGDLNEGDFYLLLTDNISDVMTITYNIYNNYTSELLMKKVYKVKFSQGGFGAVDYTGTIIEDSTYDKNGEIISGSNIGFETNGNDATTGTGSSDYYDVTDLELITNNATNTINLAKQCFAILPGFIWVMVGIFLSVCLALRILGR